MRLLQTATLLAICIFALGCTREASYYVERGNEFFDEGGYKEAALQYQKAIQQDPQLGEAYYRLALTEIEQGNAQEALTAMRRAAELAPELIDAKVKLAEMSLAVYAGYPAGNKAMYELAKKIADDFLSEDSSSYEGLVLSGQLAMLDRNPDAAAAFFADAARSDPSRPQAVGLQVQAMADAGRIEEAFELGEKALQDHPDFGPIYDVLYRLYINANRISDGQRVLQAKVDNNPNELEFRLQLAEHWARAGNRNAMESTLEQVLDQPEAFPSARMAIGDFLMRSGGFEEAIRAYREGAEEEPQKQAQYLVRIAQVQRRQGDTKAAIRTAREAIVDGASDPAPFLVLADLLAERGQPGDLEEAVESYQKAKETGDLAPETDLKLARAPLPGRPRRSPQCSSRRGRQGPLLLEPRLLRGRWHSRSGIHPRRCPLWMPPCKSIPTIDAPSSCELWLCLTWAARRKLAKTCNPWSGVSRTTR